MAFGRRKSDWDFLNPEQKAKAFDRNVGKHVTKAADKRLKGQAPYDQEPDQRKTKKSGFFSRKKK